MSKKDKKDLSEIKDITLKLLSSVLGKPKEWMPYRVKNYS